MAKSVDEIISFAMELSEDARIQIAQKLTESVEEPALEPGVMDTARRRSHELMSGEKKVMDFDAAMSKARDLLRQCK